MPGSVHGAEKADRDGTAPTLSGEVPPEHKHSWSAIGAGTSAVSRHVGSRATQAQLGPGGSGKAPEEEKSLEEK